MLGDGGNVLVRVGPPRVAILLGAGLGVQRTMGRLDTVRTCEAVVARGCVDHPDVSGSQQSSQVTLRPRVLYGVEAVIAPRLAAFTTLRWGGLGAAATNDDSDFPGMSLLGGVRVALRTRPAAGGLMEVTVTEDDRIARRCPVVGSAGRRSRGDLGQDVRLRAPRSDSLRTPSCASLCGRHLT